MLTLATSAFLVLAAEPLYLLVDTAVVGHLGAHALGALAVGTTLMAVLAIVGTFVEYGTTSRAARWFGNGQRDRAVDEGVQASYLAVVIGVVVVVVGQLFAGPLRAAAHRVLVRPAARRPSSGSGSRCAGCRWCCSCWPATAGCAASS